MVSCFVSRPQVEGAPDVSLASELSLMGLAAAAPESLVLA